MNEADTCRKQVVPLLQAAGWDNEPHSIAEQRTILPPERIAASILESHSPGKRQRPRRR